MTVKVYEKGTEDIYSSQEGDVIVKYYLICQIENNQVVKSVVFAYDMFAYDSSEELYINLPDDERKLRRHPLQTEQDAIAYNVSADEPASVENSCRLSSLMMVDDSDEIYSAWMEYLEQERLSLEARRENDDDIEPEPIEFIGESDEEGESENEN